jgi:HD-like signal output (HDOD) protein/ActR/RegA family two-component response regulator
LKSILFVDDERELLDGLRARLYKHRKDWYMQFVVSGDEALAILAKEPIDLIVSDVRMPGMDGGQLLTLVKERWPTTIRIIVSGYSDPVQAARLTSLAHQYVAKPCEDRQVENTIERCFRLRDLLSQDSLRQVVGRIGRLPAMPKTYSNLQAALAQPSVTAGQIGDIVMADPAIATKVLQITNSAFFRLRKPIVRIKDAVTYLGFATVRNLVLCAEVFSQWRVPKELGDIDPDDLQQHAQHAAAACKSLAAIHANPDDAWLAGLVHDIGYWIMIQECPKELARALEMSRAENRPVSDCERLTVGATHAEIGAYLLGLWVLPYPIVEAVALHHNPTAITSQSYDLVGALAVSQALLGPKHAHALGNQPDEKHSVDAEYLKTLNAPFDWDEARQRVQQSTVPAE